MSDTEDTRRPELNISPISFVDGDFVPASQFNRLMQPNMSNDIVFSSESLESVNSNEEFNYCTTQLLSTNKIVPNNDLISTPKRALFKWSNKEILKDNCQTSETAVVLSSKTALKIKVNKLKMAARWKWIYGGDDRCGICRAPFEGCCIDCKMPGDDCPLVIGACKHPFHIHCIVKWTNTQQKAACPLCRQEWKFQSAE